MKIQVKTLDYQSGYLKGYQVGKNEVPKCSWCGRREFEKHIKCQEAKNATILK